MGAILHDFDKRQQIVATREANQTGISPLIAVRSEEKIAEDMLQTAMRKLEKLLNNILNNRQCFF